MRLKFWKHEDYPEYYPPKKPRQKKTMRSVAEKLVMKEMEASNDIDLAEKVLKISKPPARSLSEMLEEYRKNEELMGRGGGQGSGALDTLLNSEFAKGAGETLVKMMTPQQQQRVPIQRPQQEQIVQPQETPALPESKTISPLDLTSYLDYEPADTIQELKGMAEQGDPQANALLTFLKQETYGSLVAKLEPFKQNPEFKEGISELLSPERKAWLSKVLNLAKE